MRLFVRKLLLKIFITNKYFQKNQSYNKNNKKFIFDHSVCLKKLLCFRIDLFLSARTPRWHHFISSLRAERTCRSDL